MSKKSSTASRIRSKKLQNSQRGVVRSVDAKLPVVWLRGGPNRLLVVDGEADVGRGVVGVVADAAEAGRVVPVKDRPRVTFAPLEVVPLVARDDDDAAPMSWRARTG